MNLSPHLSFNGQCQEAMEFYQRCLGAQIQQVLTFGAAPMSERVPAEWRGKILHGTFAIGQSVLYAGDAPPERYQAPRGFQLTLGIADIAEAERVFGELSEGGAVKMPLQKTFWASRFGVVEDRFGIAWKVNCPGGPE